MRITVNASAREIRGKANLLYRIRLLTIFICFPVFFLVSKLSGTEAHFDLFSILVLGLLEIFLNCPYPVYFKTPERAYKFLAASVMVDFMAESLAVHFGGGIEPMFFTALYLITILYCALNFPVTLNFLMATLASFLYSGLVAAEYWDVIPHPITLGLYLTWQEQLSDVITHVALFYLIAIFARYLANALIEKEKRIASLFKELREAYQKARYAYRIKSEFLAQMSHELRAPLNTVMNLTELLRSPMSGSLTPKQKDYLDNMEKNAKHVLSLINDVLDISKLEAKKTVLHYSDVNLLEACKLAVDLFYEEAASKQISIKIQNSLEINFIFRADARKIQQVLFNLMSNAIKYTPNDGSITLNLRKEGACFILSVADTGTGIPQEDQKRIFEPYECSREENRNIQGTGLGLSITKQFIEMHHGEIFVESTPGKGSRFTIKLPEFETKQKEAAAKKQSRLTGKAA